MALVAEIGRTAIYIVYNWNSEQNPCSAGIWFSARINVRPQPHETRPHASRDGRPRRVCPAAICGNQVKPKPSWEQSHGGYFYAQKEEIENVINEHDGNLNLHEIKAKTGAGSGYKH